MLPSVAAAVIGGTSIMGGRGGYAGTIVGALILTVLTSLLSVARDARGGPPDPVRRDHRRRGGRLHPGHRRDLTRGRGGRRRARTRHLGLDLGGTNLKWVIVEHAGDAWRAARPRPGRRRRSRTVPSRRDRSRPARRRWRRPSSPLGRRVASGSACPGCTTPRPARRGSSSTSRAWDGVAGRRRRSAAALGLPVALINDARAFGLAELRLGAGRGARSMVGLTLGTGVGGVIAIDGRVHQGHDGTAGELGHQTIDPDGPWCGCGNRGCLEAFARADRIAAACGTATAEEAVRAAQAGDERAREGSRRSAATSGSGSPTCIVALTPDRVVIGGGVAAAGDLLLDPIRAELARRVTTTSIDDVVVVAPSSGRGPGRSARRSTAPSRRWDRVAGRGRGASPAPAAER